MKKLLLILGLIGSVYGSEKSVSSWNDLVSYCTCQTNVSETICGNSVTFDNVYTLKKDDNNNKEYTVSGFTMPEKTKIIIPSDFTLRFTPGTLLSYYIYGSTAIQIDGKLITSSNRLYFTKSNTNSYIIVNGILCNEDNKDNNATIIYLEQIGIKLYILGSGVMYTNDKIPYNFQTSSSGNNMITFSGDLSINNIKFLIQASNSSINFSQKKPVNNIDIGMKQDTTMTIGEDTTIYIKGMAIYASGKNNTSGNNLTVNGKIIFERGENGVYPVFADIKNISGSGVIDMSALINANMTADKGKDSYLNTEEKGTINISIGNSFTGTIKLPYNTTCTALDLSNATKATILVPVLNREGIILDENKITKGKTITKLTAAEFSELSIKLPGAYASYNTYEVYQNIPLTIPNIIKSEYNTADYYIITDELEETIYEINEGEDVIVKFGIKGRTPLDLRGSGKITFMGDNSEYKIPRPMIKFEGEKSVFPRDAIYDHVEFAEGSVIPKDTIIVAKNPKILSDVTVQGHLIL